MRISDWSSDVCSSDLILPALYAPLIAMLLGLIFRGVAFEFRHRTVRGQYLWDWGFAGGSILAALAQGITLGALVQGIEVENRAYAGGWWDWLTPRSEERRVGKEWVSKCRARGWRC